MEERGYKSAGVPKQSRGYYARNSVKIAPRGRHDISLLAKKEHEKGRFRLGSRRKLDDAGTR